jgi:hypothetical protein
MLLLTGSRSVSSFTRNEIKPGKEKKRKEKRREKFGTPNLEIRSNI